MHEFSERVQKVMNPWSGDSGTVHVAPFLYDLVRTTRPRTVIEYGSGYSTPFLAQALKDNISSFYRERTLLIEKSKDFLRELRHSRQPHSSPEIRQKMIRDWVVAGGEASCLDPRFYLEPYEPLFSCFESLPENHTYCLRLRGLLEQLDVSARVKFTYAFPGLDKGGRFLDSTVIDLAWNDFHHYREFFLQLWPRLSAAGGLMLFHYGNWPYERDIKWMQSQRAEEGDLELAAIIEPHKLGQRGCFVLRKRSSKGSFAQTRWDGEHFIEVLDALIQLVDGPRLDQ